MSRQSPRTRAIPYSNSYSNLEPKQLLTTFTVNTTIDDGGLVPDGLISLREAVVAANTNAPFGDAPAGSMLGDVIEFDGVVAGETIQLDKGGFSISESLTIRGAGTKLEMLSRFSTLFEIATSGEVRLNDLSIIAAPFHSSRAATLSGGGILRITNSSFSGFPGAVSVTDSSLRVLDSVFTDNDAGFGNGGAILVSGGDTTIKGSTFLSNLASDKGGAISLSGGTHVVSDSVFEDNSTSSIGGTFPGSSGGAIDVDGPDTTLRVFGGRFLRNFANMGGAISSDGHLVIRENTVFSENSIDSPTTFVHGGAIQSSGRLTMVDVVVQSNTSTESGGGIFHEQGSALFNRVRLIDNHATIFGGGLSISDANARLINVTVEANSSGWQGGGIHISNRSNEAVVQIIGSEITANSAATLGGGIYAGKLSIPSVENSNVFVAIYGGTSVTNNSVTRSHEEGDSYEPSGGGIYSAANLLQMNDVLVENNTSVGDGGGVSVASGLIRMGDSDVSYNRAQRNGGGLNIDGGNVSLFRTNVGGDSPDSGNLAGQFSADGTHGIGGGVHIGNSEDGSRFFMSSGVLGNNIAKIAGGGLASVSPNSVARFQNGVRVISNRALVEDGGGVFVDSSHLEVRDSLFEQNSARDGGGIFLDKGSGNVLGASVQSNTARLTGGGIFAKGFLRLSDSSTVENNVAPSFPNVLVNQNEE
jgi:predicted outer membrane repeat protein